MIAPILMIIILAGTEIDYVAPGGIPGHTGSQRQMVYVIVFAIGLTAVAYFLLKKKLGINGGRSCTN
ncbi:MAG: hypothetical protein ACJ73C_02870 [Nitrososphaeraceae archaeon]